MKVNIGIGFVTGRRLFQNVLKTYINNWLEHGFVQNRDVKLHLFIAYDLKYKNTQIGDYKKIPPELAGMVESINFYGSQEISREISRLNNKGILDPKEAALILGDGYGKKRNAVMYFAIKHKMDKLIFIDDDEYPLAPLKTGHENLSWMGQSIMSMHLKYNADADITHGHHCGYISPIPFVKFNDILTEADFKNFIEAISNDIINWGKIRNLIVKDKGVTFADQEILKDLKAYEVVEKNGIKFISGANLCLNLKNSNKLPPFYNPPGARGEDTFMSTALTDLKVVKVPCYTFHDGFSMYNNILHGVLPTSLLPIEGNTKAIIDRFVKAAIGWVRYKPLLLYITKRGAYEQEMDEMKKKLESSIPKLCEYFDTKAFEKIYSELALYRKNVESHYRQFEKTKLTWTKLLNSLE